jgi:hypothetical protein
MSRAPPARVGRDRRTTGEPRTVRNSSYRSEIPMDTRTIAIVALVLAVILVLVIFVI